MSRALLTQLIVLEIAVAAVAIGLVEEGPWLVVGVAVAALCLLALLPWRRRSLHRVVRSWWGMRGRRKRLRGAGVGSLVGGACEVVTVPRGSGGVTVGALRDATTWTVPLSLPLVDVFNDDPPIPLERLASLLTVEDVPLSSVRVVSLVSPSLAAAGPADGASVPLSRLVTRFLVLTLDTAYASDVIAARGGGAAVPQILRRCVLRAEEVLHGAGVAVRRLPADVVGLHHGSSLGPLGTGADGSVPPATERFDHVTVAGSRSVTFAVTGPDALTHLERIAAVLPVPLVATSVALHPGPPPRREPVVSLLLRLTGPDVVVRDGATSLESTTRRLGLTLHRLLGDQVPHLRATTLLGVPAEAR